MKPALREDYLPKMVSAYQNPHSLMHRRLRIIDSYLPPGNMLLDIGMGTGEFIELEKHKFRKIYGLDVNEESIETCQVRFQGEGNITLIRDSITSLRDYFRSQQFDYITCLDVLEHIELKDCKKSLSIIADLLCGGGKFIFTGPGVFEKIRIALGKSPTHIHSHSSYGWERLIMAAGLTVESIETVEFPVIHSDFLRKRFHLFGQCCLIVARKPAIEEIHQPVEKAGSLL